MTTQQTRGFIKFAALALLFAVTLPFQNCGRLEAARTAELLSSGAATDLGTQTPPVSTPPVTNPPVTTPPTTDPVTTPPVTTPPVTTPPVTTPPVTTPPVTTPPVTTPPVTTPPVTTPPVTTPPVVGPMTFPEARVPFVTAVQMKPGDDTDQGLDLVADAGFAMMRKGIYWSKVETTKGVYDFSSYDDLFADADRRGQYMSATLYSNNSLYESGLAITTAAGRRGFAAFAAAAAVHFRGRKIIFEIWNEPNVKTFWRTPSNTAEIAAEYVALVKTVVPAMKTAAPGTLVVAGSISCLWTDSYRWFDAAVAQGLLTSGIDALSVHPYGFKWPELATVGYDVVRAKMTAAGTVLPLVNTEVGYDVGSIRAGMGYTVAEAPVVQGWLLVRQQLIDLMSGFKYSNWYEFRDTASWGVVNLDFTKRPSFGAAQTFTQQLNGFAFVERIPMSSPLDYVLRFRDEGGRERLVAWTTSTMADAAANRRAHPHQVTLNIPASSVKIVDVDGTVHAATATSDAVTFTIEGAPKYLYPASQL